MKRPKIFRLCPAPLSYLSEFRTTFRLDMLSFSDQVKILREENVILPGGWAAAMETEGFEVFETLYNDMGLQLQWASEMKSGLLKYAAALSEIHFQIFKEQVKFFDPDIIYIHAGAYFEISLDVKHREEIRSVLQKPVIITGFWGDELPSQFTYKEYFKDVDFMFCASSHYEKKFIEAGIPAKSIGACFDESIRYVPSKDKNHEFVFCGNTGYKSTDHIERYEKLVEIMSKSNLYLLANEHPAKNGSRIKKIIRNQLFGLMSFLPEAYLQALKKLFKYLRSKRFFMSESGYRYLKSRKSLHVLRTVFMDVVRSKEVIGVQTPAVEAPSGSPHENSYKDNYFNNKEPLFKLFPERVGRLFLKGTDYLSFLADSKIVLNIHRDEDADVGNIRCFEVTGVGSCLVTDKGPELKEFFDVENEIVTYDSIEECLEKVDYLLSHPEEMERISKNGQRATLSRHLLKHRTKETGVKLRELLVAMESSPAYRVRSPLVVHAVYDIEKHPISYDIAFFLQASEIYKKINNADDLVTSILWPKDIKNCPGVSKDADLAVNADARSFRIKHVMMQLVDLFESQAVIQVKDRNLPESLFDLSVKNQRIIPFPPPEVVHHSYYYRLVNENPELVSGFSASAQAHQYVNDFICSNGLGPKILCITLRQYKFDPQRNSNMLAWEAFLDRVDQKKYSVVVIPDTDQFSRSDSRLLREHVMFTPACFDVDLRFALYERAFLNMFVNNGPGTVAGLNPKIRFLKFKLLAPNVPHCTKEFLLELGYEIGKSPEYMNKFQKWVWNDDDSEILWKEFKDMEKLIESSQDIEQKSVEQLLR